MRGTENNWWVLTRRPTTRRGARPTRKVNDSRVATTASRRSAATSPAWRQLGGQAAAAKAALGCVALAAAVAGCGSAAVSHVGHVGDVNHAGPSRPASASSPQASARPGAATSVSPLAAGQQGSQQQVPWAQVGPGWILSQWAPTATTPVATSLFLIDPAGGRYLIDTLPASQAGSTATTLVAWSGDGQRALLASASGTNTSVTVLDLRTLATTEFELQGDADVNGFTAPDGLAIIASMVPPTGGIYHLARFSLTGQLELSYPGPFTGGGGQYAGAPVYSPDGTELAVDAAQSSGVAVMDNQGQGQSFLPVNPSVQICGVLRWWTADELLVNCRHNAITPQLWLVPVSGATPTALTASPSAPGDDGDLDAWQLPSGTYVQDVGPAGESTDPCGSEYVSSGYVARLQPDGLTSPVAVPTVSDGDSTSVIGAQSDSLAIVDEPANPGSPGTCAGNTLLWFDTATDAVTPLLGGPVNGGTVEQPVVFDEPQPPAIPMGN
jgi:hypothetical protein